MALVKFAIPPDQDGYAFEDGLETISTQMDGGAARYRSDVLGANGKVGVKWTLDQAGYGYFRAFYRAITSSGATPFLIDLYSEDGFALVEHEAHFIPGSVKLSSQRGNTFIVSAALDVSQVSQSEYAEDYVYLYNEYGSDFISDIDLLNEIVNDSLPDALGNVSVLVGGLDVIV